MKLHTIVTNSAELLSGHCIVISPEKMPHMRPTTHLGIRVQHTNDGMIVSTRKTLPYFEVEERRFKMSSPLQTDNQVSSDMTAHKLISSL